MQRIGESSGAPILGPLCPAWAVREELLHKHIPAVSVWCQGLGLSG